MRAFLEMAHAADVLRLSETGRALLPACDVSAALLGKLSSGELIEVDWKNRKTRSTRWHRRYFGLCNLIFHHCDCVVINGARVQFTSVDSVHLTLKGLAGLYDAAITLPDGSHAFLIRSIAFDRMTADEWTAAWPRILDVVHQQILPEIDPGVLQEEIARVAT